MRIAIAVYIGLGLILYWVAALTSKEERKSDGPWVIIIFVLFWLPVLIFVPPKWKS